MAVDMKDHGFDSFTGMYSFTLV